MTNPSTASSGYTHFPKPFITISSRTELITAINTLKERNFTALSPIHAGASFGVMWWCSLIKGTHISSILDCGASVALATEALHVGIDGVVCRDSRPANHADNTNRIFLERPQSLSLAEYLSNMR